MRKSNSLSEKKKFKIVEYFCSVTENQFNQDVAYSILSDFNFNLQNAFNHWSQNKEKYGNLDLNYYISNTKRKDLKQEDIKKKRTPDDIRPSTLKSNLGFFYGQEYTIMKGGEKYEVENSYLGIKEMHSIFKTKMKDFDPDRVVLFDKNDKEQKGNFMEVYEDLLDKMTGKELEVLFICISCHGKDLKGSRETILSVVDRDGEKKEVLLYGEILKKFLDVVKQKKIKNTSLIVFVDCCREEGFYDFKKKFGYIEALERQKDLKKKADEINYELSKYYSGYMLLYSTHPGTYSSQDNIYKKRTIFLDACIRVIEQKENIEKIARIIRTYSDVLMEENRKYMIKRDDEREKQGLERILKKVEDYETLNSSICISTLRNEVKLNRCSMVDYYLSCLKKKLWPLDYYDKSVSCVTGKCPKTCLFCDSPCDYHMDWENNKGEKILHDVL